VNGSWLLPMVGAAVLGSVHCIGMCGGLIAVSAQGATSTRDRLTAQLGYQAGRLLSYLALGVSAGLLGSAVDLAGQAAGLGKAAAIVSGFTMMLWGVWAMLEASGSKLAPKLPTLSILPARARVWLDRAQRQSPLGRSLLLGGASALLPCGFLYTFALAAAGTGSPLAGALVMGSLWLGNLPALLGFGLAVGGVLSRLKRHIPLLSAGAVFLLGLLTLSNRINLPAFAAASIAQVNERGAKSSPTLDMPADCPCHKGHRK
jgi:sulfite exporter TauE/SafE